LPVGLRAVCRESPCQEITHLRGLGLEQHGQRGRGLSKRRLTLLERYGYVHNPPDRLKRVRVIRDNHVLVCVNIRLAPPNFSAAERKSVPGT